MESLYQLNESYALSEANTITANAEVNISHETTTMVVWIYDGI